MCVHTYRNWEIQIQVQWVSLSLTMSLTLNPDPGSTAGCWCCPHRQHLSRWTNVTSVIQLLLTYPVTAFCLSVCPSGASSVNLGNVRESSLGLAWERTPGRVLIWDCTQQKCHPAHCKLPLQAELSPETMAAVAYLWLFRMRIMNTFF